jgi:hypothetical protein
LKTRVLSSRQIRVGPQVLDFFDNEHLVDIGQAKTLLSLLLRFEKLVFKKRLNLESAVRLLWKETLAGGLPGLDENDGGMVQVRPLDFAHVLNRFRFLKIRVPAKRPDEPGSTEPDPAPPTP